jgi:hypothetical protein
MSTQDVIVSPDVRRAARIPPRQAVTRKWPILHHGPTPRFDRARWRIQIFGLGKCWATSACGRRRSAP